jgi:hypothetical protein
LTKMDKPRMMLLKTVPLPYWFIHWRSSLMCMYNKSPYHINDLWTETQYVFLIL